jgi:hypothetical protein
MGQKKALAVGWKAVGPMAFPFLAGEDGDVSFPHSRLERVAAVDQEEEGVRGGMGLEEGWRLP